MMPSKDLLARVRAWIVDGTLPAPRNPADARDFAGAACHQGLVAWLDDALPADAAAWPRDLRDDLRRAHRVALVDGVRRHDLARRAQHRLRSAGVRSLALKGAAVAETLYPTAAHRPLSDVDLLVLDPPADARATLRSAGFRETSAADHAWVLEDPGGAGVLELHHSVTSCPGLFPLDAAALWDAGVETPSGLHVPGHEHLLVLLALHAAFQHGLGLSVVQYLDFRRLLERPLDAVRVQRYAGAAGAAIALALSLRAAEAVVGARVPEDLQRVLPSRDPRAWPVRKLRDPVSLLSPATPDLGRARWAAAHGRRWELIRLTLAGPAPERPLSSWRNTRRHLGRAWRLARRYAHG